jgi:hypothetical protein
LTGHANATASTVKFLPDIFANARILRPSLFIPKHKPLQFLPQVSMKFKGKFSDEFNHFPSPLCVLCDLLRQNLPVFMPFLAWNCII